MGSDNTSITKRITQELKVGLLEEGLGGALWIGTVGDDDIEFILAVSQELEAITHVDLDVGMLETNAHAGEVFFGNADDSLKRYEIRGRELRTKKEKKKKKKKE